LRTSLDVSFAEVTVSEAELMVYHADNRASAAQVELSAVMGDPGVMRYELADVRDLPALESEERQLAADALANRPEVAVLRKQLQAARSLALSESRLAWPSVTATGVAGFIPAGDERLKDKYGGIAVNLNVPVFNGGLNPARRLEAEARVRTLEQELRELQIRIARDVRTAWLAADNAYRRLEVTARLLDQASRTLRLARTRYELGLSNIVEYTQADLGRTSAEFTNAAARYEYLIRRAELDYQCAR
jgi:outer membrane protein